ncbi:porin family protein [Aurantivibrio plasticivorans]
MKLLISFTFLFFCSLANAEYTSQTEGFYVGGSWGLTQYEEDGFFDDSVVIGSSFDDDAVGLSIFGGYNVNKWLSVEAGLTVLGVYYEDGEGANDDDYTDTAASAITVSALANIPMGDVVSFYLQGGFGIALITQEIDYDDTGINVEEDEADTAPAAQLGIGFKLNLPAKSHTQLRVGYQRFIFESELSKVTLSNTYVTQDVDQEIDYFFFGASFTF